MITIFGPESMFSDWLTNNWFLFVDEVSCVESTKSASDIYSPLSGKVVEVNTSLEEEPSKCWFNHLFNLTLINDDILLSGLINTSCYDQGWIYKLQTESREEFDKLMTEDEYNKFLSGIEGKH